MTKLFSSFQFVHFCIEKGAIGFFNEVKRLVSGRETRWYFNGRRLIDYATDLERTVKFVLWYCEDNGIMPDYFLGVPEGLQNLVTVLNMELGGKVCLIRKVPKEHGLPQDRYFSGPVEPGDKPLLLEDVTTTGGSLVARVKQCLEAELDLRHTLCECNRLELVKDGDKDLQIGVSENISLLTDGKVTHHSLTNAGEILPVAYETLRPKEEIARFIEKEFTIRGVKRIKLLP